MAKIYGYAIFWGNESQLNIEDCKQKLVDKGVKPENLYIERDADTKDVRYQLEQLFNVVNKGDTIVTTSASRLAYSIERLCEFIKLAKEKHIRLIIGDRELDFSEKELNPFTEGIMQMMYVFEEMNNYRGEKKIGRPKGMRGRPKKEREDLPEGFKENYPRYKNREIKVKELAKLCKISKPTVHKYIYIFEKAELDAIPSKTKYFIERNYSKYIKKEISELELAKICNVAVCAMRGYLYTFKKTRK